MTPDLVRSIPGPPSLAQRRQAAADRAAALPLPQTDEEIWRYSRIDEFDLARWPYAPSSPSVVGAADVLSEPLEGDTVAPAPDLFAEWNAALSEPTVLRTRRGQVVESPIIVEHTAVDGASVYPRLIVHAAADSEITVVERFRSDTATAGFVAPVVEIHAGPAARVKYVAVNELGTAVWFIGHQLAWADRDASVSMSTVSLGGDYARVRTEVVAGGTGSSTRQTALYFADGNQMHDFRTIQSHVAPRTQSNLLFKGAVKDHARSVYTGLIRIGHEARGASAFQTNRNLTLSEGAWAESVPNLDIETNDVRCSHASTVGPIDAEQRFYLESRGVPPEIAERLIVLGFFDEVLEQLPLPALAAQLRARVAAKLDSVELAAAVTS
jgi:Fe-S cluster assembly protein SufD